MTERKDGISPAEKTCAYEYTVKRGDSFYLIAHRLGVPLRDLLDANPDVNPARLMVGDVLCIPLEEDDAPQEPDVPQMTVPQTETAPQTGTVPKATTSQTTAQQAAPSQEQSTTDTDEVEEELAEGQIADGALDTPASPGEGPEPDQNAVCPDALRYTLKQGETLTDVQVARGLTWHTLEQANPTADLTQVKEGETLCVPEKNIPCETVHTVRLMTEDTLEGLALRYNVSVGALLRANPCLAPADFAAGACIALPE